MSSVSNKSMDWARMGQAKDGREFSEAIFNKSQTRKNIAIRCESLPKMLFY